jgi:hypothetical protein
MESPDEIATETTKSNSKNKKRCEKVILSGVIKVSLNPLFWPSYNLDL